ncbi:MAG: hypothetical protein K6A76_08885, partial [Oribacterium sp.]|nr:hypothetical protein [Oribacterium sp.]
CVFYVLFNSFSHSILLLARNPFEAMEPIPNQLLSNCTVVEMMLAEYSGAVEPPFRKIGNRESGTGNRHTDIVTFASLLA